MGTLKMIGYAERQVQYDAIEFNLSFSSTNKKASTSVNNVLEQCDDFLRSLEEMGIKIENISLNHDTIRYDRYSENKEENMNADREINFTSDFDVRFINCILDLIGKKDYDVTLNFDYILKCKKTLHDELRIEALHDSRKQAKKIAKELGMKIVGVEHISNSNDSEYGDDEMWCYMTTRRIGSKPQSISDKLAAYYTTESESIYVTWIIE